MAYVSGLRSGIASSAVKVARASANFFFSISVRPCALSFCASACYGSALVLGLNSVIANTSSNRSWATPAARRSVLKPLLQVLVRPLVLLHLDVSKSCDTVSQLVNLLQTGRVRLGNVHIIAFERCHHGQHNPDQFFHSEVHYLTLLEF